MTSYTHPFGQPPSQLVVASLDGDDVILDPDEAHHARKSLRLTAGDTCVATDGRGGVARLELVAFDHKGATARVIERARVAPPRLRVWLVGEAEGSRSDWLVEKAAELGAWGYRPHAPVPEARRERWGRLARAALKQSLGAYRLDLGDGAAGLPWARTLAPAAVWVADPAGVEPAAGPALPASGDVVLVAGPPGGFPGAEQASWEAFPGALRVRLGARRLRAETAALALLWAGLAAAESRQTA